MKVKIKIPLPVKMGLVVLLLGFATILLALVLTGCSSAKKDAKALNRVQNSGELTKRVLDNFPCNNDTTILHDTTITTHLRVDTSYQTVITHKNDTVYVQEVQVLTQWKERVRTVEKLTNDDRKEKLREQELNKEKGARMAVEDERDTLKAELKRSNFHKWLTWILLILGVILGIFIKYKNPLK